MELEEVSIVVEKQPLAMSSNPYKSTTTEEEDVTTTTSITEEVREPLISHVPDKNLLVLEDFIRFDIIRTGAFCCTGYTISVQYDDEFLVGKSSGGNSSSGCYFCMCCFFTRIFSTAAKTNVQFYNSTKKVIFKLEFTSKFCCFRPKKRRFYVSSALKDKTELLGFVEHIDPLAPMKITNSWENRSFRSRKLRPNSYTIERLEDGVKVGVVDIFRGLRGGISSYGVSIVDDDITPTTKSLFISSVVAMDIEEREAEAKCTFLWTPLISSFVVFLFTVIPWLYYSRNLEVLSLPTPS